MPTLADLLRTPGTPANKVKTTLADLFRGYNREAVAGLLGGSVDIANQAVNLGIAGAGYAGHKLGLLAQPPELIQKPVLGSDWIYERLPNQPALTGSGAENTGRMLGALLSPPVAMQAAPATVRALGRALQEKVPGIAENYLRGIGGLKDIDVWHGSPHKFDRFDSSKIGTGDGAQAYGHGLYLADAREVGQSYAMPSTTVTALARIHGKNDPVGYLQKNYKAQVQQWGKDQVDEAIALLKRPGNLYRVDLPDHMLPRMLDWDAPLSGQSEAVRQALRLMPKNLAEHVGLGRYDDLKGGIDIYKPMGGLVGDLQTSKMLRSLGIPGIRYLDGGSRGAGTGTRNYVIFPGEEHNLRILERNGVPIK